MSDSVQPHRRQPTRLPRPWDSPGKNTGVSCHFLLQCMKVKSESEVAQSCLTLSDPIDCSLPGSSIHGIFQARVLEWGAIAFSDVLWLDVGKTTTTKKKKPHFSLTKTIKRQSINHKIYLPSCRGIFKLLLAWRIPGTEELVGLPSMGSHRVGHDWRDLAAEVFLPGESHGRRSLVGCCP